jgi:hypothetical protein
MSESFPPSRPRHPRGVRRDAADAFFPDPGAGPAVAPDDLAEELAEEFLASATMAQAQGEEGHEQFVDEEIGGPFVLSGQKEFAHGPTGWSTPPSELEAYPTPGPLPQSSARDEADDGE